MKRLISIVVLILSCLFTFPVAAVPETRVLLIACRNFLSCPDLGYEASGNLQSIAAAFYGAGVPNDSIFVEDGTIGTAASLRKAVSYAFLGAVTDDLSILYLCTHGFPATDAAPAHLMLSDGVLESNLFCDELLDALQGCDGEKLLIVDACYSDALFQKEGLKDAGSLGHHLHVLTSAGASEASWYYSGAFVPGGAVSCFASALCAGLGLYGKPDADSSQDGTVDLNEMLSFLRVACASSTAQMHSYSSASVHLPVADTPLSPRALSSFSFGSSSLLSEDGVFSFSFTILRSVQVLYRITERTSGGWDWPGSITIPEESVSSAVGRISRRIAFASSGSRAFLLQVFSVEEGLTQLCCERLISFEETP